MITNFADYSEQKQTCRQPIHPLRTPKCDEQVPRRLFLPFLSRVEVSSSFKFHVFLLLQPFLNVCYFTLLTPFRFTKDSKGLYILQINPVQRVLSTVVIISAIVYALLDLRYWLEQNLKEKPQEAFSYASYLLRSFIPLLWGVTFLVKRKWFSKLLLVCQEKRSSHSLLLRPNLSQRKNVKPNWKLRAVLGITLVLTIAKFLHCMWLWEKPKNIMLFSIRTILHNFNQCSWEDSEKEAKGLYEKGSISTNLIAYLSSFLYVVDIHLQYMFDYLCFVGATMVYAVCGYFTEEMENLSKAAEGEDGDGQPNNFLRSKQTLKSMQRNYIDLVAILDSINEVFGPPIVLFFLRSYPNLVYSIFGLFQQTKFESTLFYMHKILLFVLVTVTAAEGNAKVGQFQHWLFRTSMASLSESGAQDDEPGCDVEGNKSSGNLDLAGLNILHREVSTAKLGLKGYKFFTVTHGLIGTMLGIVVTYAIVMLQFEMEAEGMKRALSNFTSNGTGGHIYTTVVPPYLSTAPGEEVNMTEEFDDSV